MGRHKKQTSTGHAGEKRKQATLADFGYPLPKRQVAISTAAASNDDKTEEIPSTEGTPYVKALPGYQGAFKGIGDLGFSIRSSKDFVPSTVAKRKAAEPSPCRDIANTQHASTSTCMLTRPPPLSPLAHLPAPGAVGAHDTTADNMTTPEMQCSNQLCTIEQDGTHTRPVERPLFPLFRPREQVKLVYMVRHGESEFNAALSRRGSAFSDPQIFDAPLSARGCVQATSLRAQLRALDLPPDVLWVSSPLTRALETFWLGCPMIGRCGEQGAREIPPGNMAVCSDLSEHCYTCGDVGRPPPLLIKQFPQLARHLEELPQVWWYSPTHAPNCAVTRVMNSRESTKELKQRVGAFRAWVLSRPERVIVAFGHSTFFKEFAQLSLRMANCEVKLLRV